MKSGMGILARGTRKSGGNLAKKGEEGEVGERGRRTWGQEERGGRMVKKWGKKADKVN